MKQRIGFLFLFVLLFYTMRGLAEENEYTLRYIFKEDGTATVAGYEGEPVNLIVPEEIEDENGKKYTVTTIGDSSFFDCSSLNSIDFPDGLTSIGEHAFLDCRFLTSISLPESLTSIGEGAFNGCSSLASIDFPEGLTSIGSYAFGVCSSLTSISLPESLTSISTGTFGECTSLSSIDFPKGLKSIGDFAFWRCTSLTSIDLPEELTTINNQAFSGCSSLTSIELPGNLTSLGVYAFMGCKIKHISYLTNSPINASYDIFDSDIYSLDSVLQFPEESKEAFMETVPWCCFFDKEREEDIFYSYNGIYAEVIRYNRSKNIGDIVIPETAFDKDGNSFTVNKIGDDAFYECQSLTSITLPQGLTSIGDDAFLDCHSLTSVDLPDELTSIGDFAFKDCTSLTSIDLPEGLTSIGRSMFSGCTSLTSIDLPVGLTSIGRSMFSDCTSLTSIDLPVGLTSISHYAFSGCTSLTSIDLPVGLTSIGYEAFYECRTLTSITLPEGLTDIGGQAFLGCTSLTSIDLPQGLTSIGDGAFSGCTSLASIALPEGLTFIRNYAFSGCTSLSSIDLPDGLTSIGWHAFQDCTSLTSIDLPEGLTSIGEEVFKGCPLEKITYLSQTPISAVDNIFDSEVYETAILEIPKGSRETFIATTPWNLFKNIVEDGEEEPDPVPGEKYHLLTVNITNGFSAELSVKEGEKVAVALNLDEWWEPGMVKFNGEPLEVGASKIHTPEMTEPSTLEITPRYKGDVDILDFTTGVEKVEANGIEVEILDSSTVLVKGLQEGDEITVYTEAGHVIRSATATISTMTISNLVSGNVYIIRINNHAVKVML